MTSKISPEKGRRIKKGKKVLLWMKMTSDCCVTSVLKKETEIHEVDRQRDGQVVAHF